MFRNYSVVTLRNLLKNKTYSFINIAGLSIGITSSLLIMLWVFDQLSYDRFHPKVDRLYQVWVNATFDGKINSWNSLPLPTYEALKTEHANIKNTTGADWGGDHLLTVGDKRITKHGYYVGEEFLTMFEFPLLKGNAKQVLSEPGSIVLTEAAAKALFGDQDPINQLVKLDNRDELKVTGILKNVPKNSSFEFDCLLPWKLYEKQDWVKRQKDNWGNYSFQVYVELTDEALEVPVETKIKDLLTSD